MPTYLTGLYVRMRTRACENTVGMLRSITLWHRLQAQLGLFMQLQIIVPIMSFG